MKDIPFNLYIGQPIRVWLEDADGKYTIEREGTMTWNHEEESEWVTYKLLPSDPTDFDEWDFKFKLVLRPLSSMTEEDSLKVFGVKNKCRLFTDERTDKNINVADRWLFTATEFTKLLELSFDLFGLIDSGQAIDAATLKEIK